LFGALYPPRFVIVASADTLASHVRYLDRASRRLARTIFHGMLRFGPALEKKQAFDYARLEERGLKLPYDEEALRPLNMEQVLARRDRPHRSRPARAESGIAALDALESAERGPQSEAGKRRPAVG
jgi:hypothetical protein